MPIAVISGPTGAGKSVIAEAIGLLMPSVHRPISYTTRAQKRGERNGVDYHFISKEVFERRISDGFFAEYAEVHGHFYGTLKMDISIHGGGLFLLEIDVQGMRQIKASCKDVCSIIILPPTFDTLEERVRARGRGEADEEIARRLDVARAELSCAEEFDYQVVNSDLRLAVQEVLQIVKTRWPLDWRGSV